MGTSDYRLDVWAYNASQGGYTNATDGDTTSSQWILAIDFMSYQGATEVIVSLPARAHGVRPRNAAAIPAYHTYMPFTAASPRSELTCVSPLDPPTSVRRGEAMACYIVMKDSSGDPVKGVVRLFEAVAEAGVTTPLIPSADGRRALFSYTPPAVGFTDLLRVTHRGAGELVVGGELPFHVADFPDGTSTLECVSPSAEALELPAWTTIAGETIQCTVSSRVWDSVSRVPFVALAVTADFNVTAKFAGDVDVLPLVSPMVALRSGRTLLFNVTTPALTPETPQPVGLLRLFVRTRFQDEQDVISGGDVSFHVTHPPHAVASFFTCTRVERANGYVPVAELPLHGVSVAAYETVLCAITGAVESGLVVKTIAKQFEVWATSGFVSALQPSGDGQSLHFWSVVRAFATGASECLRKLLLCRYTAEPLATGLGHGVSSVYVATTGVTGGTIGNITSSPMLIKVLSHTTAPPYLRCDSGVAPLTTVVPATTTTCRLYGMEPDMNINVSAGLGPSTFGNVTSPVAEDSVGRTYVFTFTPVDGPVDYTGHVAVRYNHSHGLIALPPPFEPAGEVSTNLDVAGHPAGLSSIACDNPGAVGTFTTRGAVLRCSITVLDSNGDPTRAAFGQFAPVVTVNAGDTRPGQSITRSGCADMSGMPAHGAVLGVPCNFTATSGGAQHDFLVAVPWQGSVFTLSVAASVATGPHAGEQLAGSPLEYVLTDTSPPQWLVVPRVLTTDLSTITLTLSVDEPVQLYVGGGWLPACTRCVTVAMLRRFLRIFQAPSPPLDDACDVIPATHAIRPLVSCAQPPSAPALASLAAVVTTLSVPTNLAATTTTVVLGTDGVTLESGTTYHVWLVAADFSSPPNIQVGIVAM